MKTFKNKVTGEVVSKYNETHYQDSSSALVHKRFIVNSCDWEEVVREKRYEILSFSYDNQWGEGNVAKLGEDGNYSLESGHTKWELHSLLAVGWSVKSGHVKIHSVKRLSDGEIFTIGDKAKDGKYGTVDIISNLRENNNSIYVSVENLSWGQDIEDILLIKPLYTTYDGVERFEFSGEHWVINDDYAYYLFTCNLHLKYLDNRTWKLFSTEEKALEYLESIKPKPLFTTEDGKDIFEGHTYWCVNTAPHLWSLFLQTAKERTKLNKGVKAFSAKELAEEYLLMKKPLLSLEDLLSVWSYSGRNDELVISSPLFKSFKNLAKTK